VAITALQVLLALLQAALLVVSPSQWGRRVVLVLGMLPLPLRSLHPYHALLERISPTPQLYPHRMEMWSRAFPVQLVRMHHIQEVRHRACVAHALLAVM